jgi:AraC-like DNA-binding protein
MWPNPPTWRSTIGFVGEAGLMLPQHATVLTAWTSTLLRALADRGVDGARLAAEAGIDPADLCDPDRRVPLAASTRLWHAAVDATGDPCLGLDVSRYVRPSTFYTLGHAVLTSSTLRDAMHRIARYSMLTADTAIASTDETVDGISLVITWRAGSEPAVDEAVDAIVACIVRSARFMLDRGVAPTGLALERPRPADTTPFEQLFRCPIRFGAPTVRLTFDPITADRPVAGANAEIARMNDDVTAAYLARLEPATATRRVRQVLPNLLPGGEPTVRSTASVLNTSARTLQRQLHEEGTTFRAVLRNVRRELAVGYLRGGDRSVTEITYLLGFSETPTFSRAFKQWTGVAPSHYA